MQLSCFLHLAVQGKANSDIDRYAFSRFEKGHTTAMRKSKSSITSSSEGARGQAVHHTRLRWPDPSVTIGDVDVLPRTGALPRKKNPNIGI
jgi:hypothetical protein